ncbi:3'-5' exonuclease [Acetivibrio mesophilus]|uniref:Exonuclease domain-containing protein n=1 Tax=Acetivibrio mesophilus TaxID=2487273 RepID=A0A4V1K2G7_9FIRM|nr:3'-5' exonuclease [Acetivibrio mesophilus]ODM25644.1 DNA polymerase III [Clostridium sp. Bc-iso-3]RXE60229.1 exonuclease domain-containing protein [Acetivibrio mesophilus]HHV29903.1 exonuclease domain-containing protein [Clostridium sp.]
MNYIVYDLELNSKPFKSSIPNEIIEVGAIKLNDNLQEIGVFSSFIKPKYFKKLFPVVKQKTKITQEDINNADNFRNIIKQFIGWIGDDYILISWGHDDVHNLMLNCKYNRIRTDWLKRNIDIQKQFSSIHELPPGQRYSLENALTLIGVEIGENLHRALNDAEYTAKIFTSIFDRLDLEVFNTVHIKNKHKRNIKRLSKPKPKLSKTN